MDYGKKVFLILIILIIGCEHKKFKNPSDPNNIPPAPVLIEPANDSLIPENPPLIFRWEVKEDTNNPLFGEPMESKLEISTDENFTAIESIINDFDTYDPLYDRLFGDSTYYWRVFTRYKGGSWSNQSGVFLFRVKLPIIYDTIYSGKDIAVKDNYLFFADDSSFLRIFDITNPAIPIQVKKFAPTGFFATSLFIKDRYLYALNQSFPYKFSVIDINDVLNPILLTNLDIDYPPRLKVEGNFAYIIYGYNKIIVLDVADPENVYVVDSISLPISTRDFIVKDNYLYLLSDDQFAVFDLNSDSIISTLDILYGYQLYLDGNYLFIIGQELNIIDMTNPFLPEKISTFDILGNQIYKNNNTICIIYGGYDSGSLNILDATDIRNPVNIGEIRGYFRDLVILNDKIITISPLMVFRL